MMSDIEKFKKVLTDLERKLTDAKAQRTKADEALRRGYSAHDANPRDGFDPKPLRAASQAAVRLVNSVDAELTEAKRRLNAAQNQAAQVARMDAAPNVAGSLWFEVECAPRQNEAVRRVRHRAVSADSLRSALLPGYRVVAQIFGHDEDGTGGFSVMVGQREALMAALAEMSV